ncbi:MAG TPA: MBL fold metallo-hydrolase, partial [Candidatus Acidoferrum sp.]|nr:MBL fold metallo-hydrolase [Candidatus Acidoferrum sp.]
MITLSFHGAAGTVTGSKYLVTVNDKKILVDCGMFQGAKELRARNWAEMKFDPTALEAVVLTHGHIDHVGYLPRMVRNGFNRKVYATPPTIDIATLALLDTAHLQMEDAEFRNKKKLSSHEVALPLFTTDDVELTERLFTPALFGQWTMIGEEIRFRYHVVGHILGAACVEMELNDGNRKVSILFSGDIGRYGNPLTRDPEPPPQTDRLVCETTYGGRMHPPEDPLFELANLITEVQENGSVLLIPAFAIDRTQQIIYLINELLQHHRIAPIDVHVDSPMAITATEIYVKYASYHSLDTRRLGSTESVLNGKNVFLHRKRKDSQMLNKLKGPAIIMSSSGMLTGGRILHHLLNRLDDPSTVVALAGFMAEGTLGRQLADGAELVYIHKTPVHVRAKIVRLGGLSGHADYQEILHWLEPVTGQPGRVYLTHGEPLQSQA